jgi:hypothetical protein
MGNRKKRNESAKVEYIEETELYSVNIAKIADYLKKSYRIIPKIAPQFVVGEFEKMILEILHILGIDKHVVIEFDPNAYDKPLHTSIMISKSLEEEWGKDKVDEFTKEFYNNAMKEFVDSMNIPKTKVLEGEAEAVHFTTFMLAGIYGFNAVIELDLMPPSNKIDEFSATWILVKK